MPQATAAVRANGIPLRVARLTGWSLRLIDARTTPTIVERDSSRRECREALTIENHGQDNGERCVGSKDRGDDRHRAQLERANEREVRHSTEDAADRDRKPDLPRCRHRPRDRREPEKRQDHDVHRLDDDQRDENTNSPALVAPKMSAKPKPNADASPISIGASSGHPRRYTTIGAECSPRVDIQRSTSPTSSYQRARVPTLLLIFHRVVFGAETIWSRSAPSRARTL